MKNLNFILLFIFLVASCSPQVTVVPASIPPLTFTETPTANQLPTSTPPPCISVPQAPKTELEEIAENWFQANQNSILNRNQYQSNNDWEKFCKLYQESYLQDESWVTYPTELALRFSGYPNVDNFPPTTVLTVFKRGDQRIAAVVVLFTNLLNDSVRDVETRLDLVNENNYWQIQWSGYRLRCYRNNSDEWIKTLCP